MMSEWLKTLPHWMAGRNFLPVCVAFHPLLFAGSIPLGNGSFEEGPETGVPPAWTLVAESVETSLGIGTGGSDGSGFLYIGDGHTLRQDTYYVLTQGETLTLQVDSSRGGSAYPRSIQLLAKDGTSYQVIAESLEETGSASWDTITLTTGVGAEFAGQELAVQISSGAWNEFDRIRLSTDRTNPVPYAWYRADLGVTADVSGNVTVWQTQTTTGNDLDRVVVSPLKRNTVNAEGEAVSYLNFANGGIWSSEPEFGSLEGDRTLAFHLRLSGFGDGFLFDGSSSSGLTRAQIREGFWQAGVQSGTFANADPVTTGITPFVWQTHVFAYQENGGDTQVTHWVDGVQAGTHPVAVDTRLDGLILGANGATGARLGMDLMEVQVYNRVLGSEERMQVEAALAQRFGNVNGPLSFQRATARQQARTVPTAGLHGVTALEVLSAGSTPANQLTQLSYSLNGTTEASDVQEVRLYQSDRFPFDPANATLLAAQDPAEGIFTLEATLEKETEYFWLVATMAGTSENGDVLDAEITGFVLTGEDAGAYTPTVTAPPEVITLSSTATYSTVIRRQGDDGVNTYRIPGLATSNDGTLLAVFDIRNNSSGDLPGNIDVGLMRSTDGGYTWGPMLTIMDFDGSVSGSSGNGVGDPSILVDRVTGRIWCAALHSFGNNGWAGSGPGLSKEETGQFVVNYSDDDGLTWSEPVSLTPDIKDPAWRLYFNGPGKGITTRDGTLIFPAQYRRADGVAHSNFIYSTDRGQTWKNSPPAYVNGSEWTSEAQIVELDNGDLLISMRNYVSRKERLWNVFGWDKETQTIEDGSWGTAWYEQTDPTVMASVETYSSVTDGDPWSGILFANPDSTGREKMSVRLSLDQGRTWPFKNKIDDRPAAYSCMTMLPDGDIGLLYETGDSNAYQTLTFTRFSLEWLVGTEDSDGDGISDFEETVAAIPVAETDPYAWYRADLGVTADSSARISRWATQTGTGFDLTETVGNPTLSQVARAQGGQALVITLENDAALWVPESSWGTVAGDRTIVMKARLRSAGDGFLFDGSTGLGKTRAQIRSGQWQAGVQASGADFSASDPVTGTARAGLWQEHVFRYDEVAGGTEVTHWIDGVEVGRNTVGVDTGLGGLVLGENGGLQSALAVDLAEVLVFDRLLSTADQATVSQWLESQWGDLPGYERADVVQTSAPLPRVGIHALSSLQLSYPLAPSATTLTSVVYSLSGTSDLADLEEVRLYALGNETVFDPNRAMLLATQSTVEPAGQFDLNVPISSADQTFWLAVTLRGTSARGDVVDGEITGFTLSGEETGSFVPVNAAPAPGGRTITGDAVYSSVLRRGGDDGSGNYRIPGLVTTQAGTLIASFDVRYDGNDISSPDLPANMDTAIMRSTDGGMTWSDMQIIMDFDASESGSRGNGVGDPTLLVDEVTGRIWCAALWSFGDNGWNGSGPGLTPQETGQFMLNYSDDDGLTWSEPFSITSQVKDPDWRLYFQGPGRGICTRDGILIFPSQYRDAGGVARSNFIWSDDRGETWNHGPPAVASGNPRTSEAQIVELDDGSLLLSMRNENRPGTRLWNIFSWDKETETIAEGAWGTAWSSQTDPTVMASLIRYRSTLDGHPWSGLLFSNPDSTGREKMTIRLSLDEGQTWPYKRKIDDLPAAYSCMTVLPNGDIGILYETGEASSISRLVFARFTLEWLVGDADSDGDGLSDFQEDVLGLDKADPADAEADADGDGMSNREEARANTGINDATSVLKARLQTTPSGMSLLLPSVVNTTYWLESTSSLASGVWTPVPGLKANASNSNGLRFDLPNRSEERLFYRIVVP